MRPALKRTPFAAGDLAALAARGVPAAEAQAVREQLLGTGDGMADIAERAESGLAWSYRRENGEIVLSWGVKPGPDGGEAWALPAADITTREWAVVTPEVRAGLTEARAAGCDPIRIGIFWKYAANQRWARRLGFVFEGVIWRGLPVYDDDPEGGHMALYSWQPDGPAFPGLPRRTALLLQMAGDTLTLDLAKERE